MVKKCLLIYYQKQEKVYQKYMLLILVLQVVMNKTNSCFLKYEFVSLSQI